MKYGFVIDNRKCIGCHACTTACKSEHEVPVGVNRTWVKQVEKGEFPNTRRLFSVMRCNHCEDAPCVSICPTEALYKREDGIVDFNNDRCIGCKSCMQACPYDALYIDPENNTAAKCNYCAHRIDVGLEPACVNVCPEHAIISGDMENPETEIAQLLSREQVTVRKPEKGTEPNLFYINGDEASLNPSHTEKSSEYFWSSQSLGVGHFAKEAEKMANSNKDFVDAFSELTSSNPAKDPPKPKSIELLLGKERRTYDAPDKGILWGWEVSAYVLTKAIAAGTFLVYFLSQVFNWAEASSTGVWTSIIAGLLFLAATGILLVMDLDRPDRFLYVLLRPHWGSWLVKGGYAITAYGGLLTLYALATWFEWNTIANISFWLSAITAIFVAVYTAFLFAQAKGRDFWQSPILSVHMLVHSLMAGAALFLVLSPFIEISAQWMNYLNMILIVTISINLISMLFELTITHPTEDSHRVVKMITKGRYSRQFWLGVVAFGNLIPIALIVLGGMSIWSMIAAVLVFIGLYLTEKIWIEAPQRISLS